MSRVKRWSAENEGKIIRVHWQGCHTRPSVYTYGQLRTGSCGRHRVQVVFVTALVDERAEEALLVLEQLGGGTELDLRYRTQSLHDTKGCHWVDSRYVRPRGPSARNRNTSARPEATKRQ